MKAKHQPVMLKITRKEAHTPAFATLYFDHALEFKPGQFVMVWIPGMDEKPYTISFYQKGRFGITVEAKGPFSKKAVSLEPGDLLGFRGPFGRGFSIDPSPHVAVVAGGCGMAPLAPLVTHLSQKILFIQGARTRSLLLFPGRFTPAPAICTDDGSEGHKGFVTDLLEQAISAREKKKAPPFKMVYACGPEIMMHRVFILCRNHGIACQVSLERYMRCGLGVCGACVCSDRVVCTDGPVFDSSDLCAMPDFNTTALVKSGQAVSLSDYVSWKRPLQPNHKGKD